MSWPERPQAKRRTQMTPLDRGHELEIGADPALSQEPHLHGVARRQRGVFPLPRLQQAHVIPSDVSRKVRRKHLRRHHFEDEVNHTVDALNSMYGCHGQHRKRVSLDENLFGTAAAQYDSFEFIQQMVQAMGQPPPDLTSSGALQQLRAANGYGEDEAVATGSLASFNIERISLPGSNWKPIELASLWGTDGQSKVDEFVAQQLLPPEEARVKLAACGVKAPYSDPLLRQGRAYHQFLRKLHESHLIDYSLRPGKEKIAFFCVTKKSGMLRLIVDARRSNAHFCEPSHVDLTTGEGLGALEFQRGDVVTIAQADLKDAFYHLSLPEPLRDFFTLTPVKAGDVGITEIHGVPVAASRRVTPRLAVVAMGWTWALHLCQCVHESLAGSAGLDEGSRIRDRVPPPNTKLPYTIRGQSDCGGQ